MCTRRVFSKRGRGVQQDMEPGIEAMGENDVTVNSPRRRSSCGNPLSWRRWSDGWSESFFIRHLAPGSTTTNDGDDNVSGRHTNTTAAEAPTDRGHVDGDAAVQHAKQFRPNDGRASIMRTDIITGRKRDNHSPMRPELRSCSCSSTASRVKWRTHQHTHSRARTHARTHAHKPKDPRTRLAQHPSHG